MASSGRPAPGIKAHGPGAWELIVDAGRDPLTGKRRRVSRVFRGNLRDAKKARAKLLVEVGQGKHDGTRASVDHLCEQWLAELDRKGRKPSTIHNYRRVYLHDIAPMLGDVEVVKVNKKMLTDLYGAHQDRGASAHTVYQIHATISSMMTQACRWGWRDSNPAQWAEPPPREDSVPVVPTPEEVLALVQAAKESKRPEYARAFLLAATTGIRRGELCALRIGDVDFDAAILTVSRGITQRSGQPISEGSTKNRRRRAIAVGPKSMQLVQTQVEMMQDRAVACQVDLVPDPFVFSDAVDCSEGWKPDAITQYFGRLRSRSTVRPELKLKHLRKFMDTYGQELGFSLAQVAIRAGHDPAVASRHYTGRVDVADRALASAMDDLLG